MGKTAKHPDRGTGHHHMEAGDTWPKILKSNSLRYKDRRTAVRAKHYGIWRPYTWEQYYLGVKYLALGLLSLGFHKGDKLLILGDNARERCSATLAAQSVHGVSVDADSECSPAEIKAIVLDAGTQFAVVEDQEQVDKLLLIKKEIPMFLGIVYWNYKGLTHYDNPALMGIKDVLEAGKRHEKEHPGLFDRFVESGKRDDVCALVYKRRVSDAGFEKTEYSHHTMRADVEALLRIDPWHQNDTFIPFPVFSGSTDHWLGIGCHLLSANTINFAETLETHPRDIRETQPSILCYGASSWENQAAVVRNLVSDSHVLNRWAFRLLMPMGKGTAGLHKQKKGLVPDRRFLSFLADSIMMNPLREILGLSNARICYSIGPALSPEAATFYGALKVPLLSLQETSENGIVVRDGGDELLPETQEKWPGIDGTEGASS